MRTDNTESREYHREVQESATEVVWPRKEAIPRLRRKKDSGDGTTIQIGYQYKALLNHSLRF